MKENGSTNGGNLWEPKSERLGLRGTLDLISNALRTADTANATGAITAGAS